VCVHMCMQHDCSCHEIESPPRTVRRRPRRYGAHFVRIPPPEELLSGEGPEPPQLSRSREGGAESDGAPRSAQKKRRLNKPAADEAADGCYFYKRVTNCPPRMMTKRSAQLTKTPRPTDKNAPPCSGAAQGLQPLVAALPGRGGAEGVAPRPRAAAALHVRAPPAAAAAAAADSQSTAATSGRPGPRGVRNTVRSRSTDHRHHPPLSSAQKHAPPRAQPLRVRGEIMGLIIIRTD
jgi:hypothetical protein